MESKLWPRFEFRTRCWHPGCLKTTSGRTCNKRCPSPWSMHWSASCQCRWQRWTLVVLTSTKTNLEEKINVVAQNSQFSSTEVHIATPPNQTHFYSMFGLKACCLLCVFHGHFDERGNGIKNLKNILYTHSHTWLCAPWNLKDPLSTVFLQKASFVP